MKTINKNTPLLDFIKSFLEKEGIYGKVFISEDEELKGAISVKVKSNNIKTPSQAINKTKELNEKISKILPDKYVSFTIIPS